MAQKNTILIVDDIQSNLILLDKILTNNGYKIISANNGDDAIKLAQENEIDLILLDIMMPEKDGFAVFEELKAIKKTADIPVIFLTVINNDAITVKSFEIGATDYITKPFTPSELKIRVRTQIALVNARKKEAESMAFSSATFHESNQNPLENLSAKLGFIEQQLQNLQTVQFTAEEKGNLAQLNAQTKEILSLLQKLNK